jgi:hypothetical protein
MKHVGSLAATFGTTSLFHTFFWPFVLVRLGPRWGWLDLEGGCLAWESFRLLALISRGMGEVFFFFITNSTEHRTHTLD